MALMGGKQKLGQLKFASWRVTPAFMRLSSKVFVSLILLATPVVAKNANRVFPPSAIEADELYRDWYGPTLEGLGEKPLWVNRDATSSSETIRFTFISGASLIKGWDATVIRIEIQGKHARLIARAETHDHGHREVREVANKEPSKAC